MNEIFIVRNEKAPRAATRNGRSPQEQSDRESLNMIGHSQAMKEVYRMVSLVSKSDATVLLLGETGTGKSLVADAIHNASTRKDKKMVKVNCAAIPANLIESELFGHERGSFTGAFERRIGKFELANNGTLFLDEIGEMTLEMQVKLLRVLQDREIERVGGRNSIKIDVRIIAATNRNLEEEVREGRFRADLYYRLNVFPILLPPLRKRMEDIEPLTQFFLSRYSRRVGRVMTLSSNAIYELKQHSWPGNVRELEHLVERSVLLSPENALRHIQLPAVRHDVSDLTESVGVTLEQIERKHIVMILRRCKGKIAGSGGAAAILKIPPTTLHSKMKKLRISKVDYLAAQD
ncbi:MAG TPA: sigma-54 dependent transcriptional regulator [Cyclobacteriaceae bacterium]